MLRGRLLIIDDDRVTRDGLQFAFIRRGWEVITTTTEEEGLAVLSDYDPDWVIASWDQLSGNGSSFVDAVRKKTHFVRLSILTAPGSRSRSAVLTADLKPELMLAKPIHADEVYSACTGA